MLNNDREIPGSPQEGDLLTSKNGAGSSLGAGFCDGDRSPGVTLKAQLQNNADSFMLCCRSPCQVE